MRGGQKLGLEQERLMEFVALLNIQENWRGLVQCKFKIFNIIKLRIVCFRVS